MKFNSLISTDAYKITHWLQRPEGVKKFLSYGEARFGGQHSEICFFGMQYIIKEYFMRVPTIEDLNEAEEDSMSCFGFKYFPRHIWEKVINLGYFPLRIRAVKEGTVLATSNACFTIEATEDWFADMVSHFEDWLMWNWYSTAVATRSYNIKKNILPAFKASCDAPFLDFAVNDFGYRGGVFNEGASIGGAAHLVFFNGTDNMAARKLIRDYYGVAGVGQSVWATEHSVATVWGPGEGEYEYIKAQLNRADPNAPVSIVIDSYDADNFMKKVVSREDVKSLIIARPGRTIFRPDSNDPLTNVCRYSELLGNTFGYTINNLGYKVLNHNVGLIQGDGMNERSIPEIYNEYIKTGWAAENFVTGSGGGLLVEGLTRDTDRWAVKVCHVEIEKIAEEDMSSQGGPSIGEKFNASINVSKTPKSDLTKSSKAGKLILVKSQGGNQKPKYSTYSSQNTDPNMFGSYVNELDLVFENGKLMRDQTFTEIREIANSFL